MLTGILTPCPHIRLTQETTGGHSVSPGHSRSKGQRRKQTNRHKSYPFFSYITDCQISSSQLTRILPTEENFLVKFQHHDSLTSVEFFKVWNWNICCCDLLTAVPRIKYMYNWAIKYFDTVFRRPNRYSTALKMIFILVQSPWNFHHQLTWDWGLSSYVVSSKIDITMTTINKNLWDQLKTNFATSRPAIENPTSGTYEWSVWQITSQSVRIERKHECLNFEMVYPEIRDAFKWFSKPIFPPFYSVFLTVRPLSRPTISYSVSRDRYIHLVQDDLAAYDEILDQSEPLISVLYNLVS